MSDDAMMGNVDSEELAQQDIEQANQEKMLSQSEVNALVGRTRKEAAERARKQAQIEAEQQMQQKLQELEAQKQQNPQDAQEIDADALFQQFQERMNQEQMQRERDALADKVASKYHQDIESGKQKYDDFDEVMGDFNPLDFQEIVVLLADIDNGDDVLYELSKNPQKLVMVDGLARRSYQKAHSELKKIAASIKANQQAKQEADSYNVNSPLDRLSPSNVSGDSGNLSISDMRKNPLYRG